MLNLTPSSVGAIVIAAIALFLGVFQAVLSLTLEKEPWNKWGSAISFIIFIHGSAVFLQFNLAENTINLICEHIQISCFVLLVHVCHKFTINYLGLNPKSYSQKLISAFHGILLLMIWWPGLIIKHEFLYKNFLWLSKPYIEPPLTISGKLMLVYLGFFGLYVMILWFQQRAKAGIQGRFFIIGLGTWLVFCFHDLICALGFESVQYLSIYGFLGFLTAIAGITIVKHLDMYKQIELSAGNLEILKTNLKLKVRQRTRDLVNGNKKLQTAVDSLIESEERIIILSDQTEQFSLAAASMFLIENKQQFFDAVCDAIVKYSDYNRVLISLFKKSSPYRDIIGYGGVEKKVIDRLRKVEMPPGQYDHVFENGEKLGRQSFYIPYTMKDILKQEATIYGEGVLHGQEGAWHPEDNLFVKMINEKGEFIGVISVDDSKSGLRPTDETVRPLEIFSSLISQIIVFKKEQQKAQKLEEQLMQARKMESIGTLTGGIAHDFNNILGVIIGNTELAMEKLSKSDEIYADLESIKYAGSRAADIVNQLLSFGKNSNGNLKPVRMDEILDDLQRLVKSTIPATIEVKTQFETGQSAIMADPVQVNQIFLNLCLNAAQSMEDQGGMIKIFCEVVYLTENKILEFPGLKKGHYIKIIVSDNGPGINQDILDRIFDPYFTTKDIGKGSGIGLAVVHGIVNHHHGAITVKSREEEGTSFQILFPVVEKEPEMIQVQKQTMEMGNQESILLVDDDQMILGIMGKILKQLGYNVTEALDPKKALEHFRAQPQAFDLVITDMTMPHMSGIVLTQKILDIAPQTPVIICTGYNDTINGKTAKDLKVAGLLMKPVRMKMLANEVKMALKSK